MPIISSCRKAASQVAANARRLPSPRIGFIGWVKWATLWPPTFAPKTASATTSFQIYDAFPATATRFTTANSGTTSSATPKDLASSCDIVVTMLPAGPHVRKVYLDAETGILAGLKTRTDGTSIVAAEAGKAGAVMIDAPVSGGTLGAEAGTLTFMVGAEESVFEFAKEQVLVHMGKNITMKFGCMDPKLLASILNTSSGRCWSTDTYKPLSWCPPQTSPPPATTRTLVLLLPQRLKPRQPVSLGGLAAQIYSQAFIKWLNDNAVRMEKK
ncbi:NAD binding domain of 6-phosphogluconate dehydrogenase-domain-containing protein [Chytridium lagenaria]|nr:NAD binding domain of 6-phosphogluconate dehydrogenase-domain-containing protein [Chytridium lagenaria]